MSKSHRAVSLRAHGRPGLWLVGTIVAFAVVTAAGFAGNAVLGLTPADVSQNRPTATATAILRLVDSPASKVLTDALAAAPAGWTRAGTVQHSSAAPFPFSCLQGDDTPAFSVREDFAVSGSATQLNVSAYTAGQGANALLTFNGGVQACTAGTDTVTSTPLPGLGTEAFITTVTRNNAGITVISVRRGDVIVFASSQNASTANDTIRTFDAILEPELAGVCANEKSVTADASRSPWSSTPYTPYLETKTVTIPDPGLPPVTDPTYVAHDLTLPSPTATAVIPETAPTYPVWPLMPTAVALPAKVTAPAAFTPTAATIQVPAADSTGPGCGWAFTAMTAPVYDKAYGSEIGKTTIAAAKTGLETSASAWTAAVITYWAGYEQNAAAVTAYDAYAAQVTATNSSWDSIAAQWAVYETAHAAWQVQQDAATTFLNSQIAARGSYNTALTDCQDGTTPSPGPIGTATPAPTPSRTTGSLVTDCSVTVARPAILDQTAPVVGTEPAKPADPRPVAKQ